MKWKRALHATFPALAVWALIIPLSGPSAAEVLPLIGFGPLTSVIGDSLLDLTPTVWTVALLVFSGFVAAMAQVKNGALRIACTIAWPVAGAWAYFNLLCRNFIT